MNVGAVGAVGSGSTPVYALLSPYLNGVVRTSDAAAAAQLQSTASSTSAAAQQQSLAANATAAAALTAAPPFLNPAITAIGQREALGQSLTPPGAVTPNALLGSSSLTSPSLSPATQTPLQASLAADVAVNTQISSLASQNTLTSLLTEEASELNTPSTTASTALTPAADAATSTQNASATNQVLYGDSGTLIQSYGAVALATGVQAQASAFAQPVTPAIPATALVAPAPSIQAIA